MNLVSVYEGKGRHLINREDFWSETYTGKKFYPWRDDNEIDLEDIAHALSLQCRFNGHCRHFYSIAEHSMMVASLVARKLRLQALLHDASEAYIGDMIRPLKHGLPDFVELEQRVMAQVCKKFQIEGIDPAIKVADDIALATEAKRLMYSYGSRWNLHENPAALLLESRTWQLAKNEFIKQVQEAMDDRETEIDAAPE